MPVRSRHCRRLSSDPDADHLGERLAAVLAMIYLAFNEGYLSSSGKDPQRRDLTEDAE